MARDLKKIKTKELTFDEIEIDFLNLVLDFYIEFWRNRFDFVYSPNLTNLL